MIATSPRVSLMLPGAWVRVRLTDASHIHALAAAFRRGDVADADGVVARIAGGMVPIGGESLWFRSDDRPTVILMVWPPLEERPTTLEALLDLIPAEQHPVAIEHQYGFAAARTTVGSRPDGSWGAAYWLAHPVTGRVLVLDVTVADEDAVADAADLYDAMMAGVSWPEVDDAGA